MKRWALGLLVVVAAVTAWWWRREVPAVASSDAGREALPSAPAAQAPPAVVEAAPAAPEPEPVEDAPQPAGLFLRVVRDDLCTEDGGEASCDAPVAGVRLAVHASAPDRPDADWRFTGRTNAQGELEVPDASVEFEYRAEVLDDAWFSSPVTFDYAVEPQVMVVTVSPVSTFVLRVRDPAGHPVPGASFVAALGPGGDVLFEGTTDERGEHRTARAPTGRGELEVHAEGFPDFVDSSFELKGRVEREVTLSRGREVFVRVERADGGPPLVVTLAAPPSYGQREPLAPGAAGVAFKNVPVKALTATVSEPAALFGAVTAAVVPVTATEVTLRLQGEPLVVKLEGERPRTVWASGKCCAPHFVALRCEGAPLRRMATDARPGAEVRFEYVPPVPCWVKFDDGPEQRTWAGTATLKLEPPRE